MSEKNIERLRFPVAELDRIRDEQRAYKTLYIIDSDPNAPLCIRCAFCQQNGFLFICPIFVDVGMDGIVYYRRRGHKSKTYPNTPMKEDECDIFVPIIM